MSEHVGLIFEGISFGLLLAVMLGPIFIFLTHSSIEKGKTAGILVACGVWISDLLFIVSSYLFISRIDHIIHGESFDFWMSLLGGLILCAFGIGTFLKKSKFSNEINSEKLKLKKISEFFVKGFLVNTINPFTIVFWLSVMTSYVIGRDLSFPQSFTFLSSIFATVVATDLAKVLLADVIRRWMNQHFFNVLSKIAGFGLFIFGVYLLYRSYI